MDVVDVVDPTWRQRVLLVELWFADQQWLTLRRTRNSVLQKCGLKSTSPNVLAIVNVQRYSKTLLVLMWRCLIICAHILHNSSRSNTPIIDLYTKASDHQFIVSVHGGFYKIICNNFLILILSISKIVAETCAPILEVWQNKVLHVSDTKPEWRAIADRFFGEMELSTHPGCPWWKAYTN